MLEAKIEEKASDKGSGKATPKMETGINKANCLQTASKGQPSESQGRLLADALLPYMQSREPATATALSTGHQGSRPLTSTTNLTVFQPKSKV